MRTKQFYEKQADTTNSIKNATPAKIKRGNLGSAGGVKISTRPPSRRNFRALINQDTATTPINPIKTLNAWDNLVADHLTQTEIEEAKTWANEMVRVYNEKPQPALIVVSPDTIEAGTKIELPKPKKKRVAKKRKPSVKKTAK